MRKVLILMLVFAAFGFAAQANLEGDVLLTPINETRAMAAVATTMGFDVGTKGSSEIIRDMWVGSDFDQDGKKEVMLASYGVGGRAYVYEIDANNSATLFFDTGDMGSSYTSATRHVAFGDLDGNGMQELLVSVNSADVAVRGLWAFEYDTVGDSMRAPVQLFGTLGDRWYVENFTIGDVDKDGVEEIIFGNNGSTNANDNFYIASVDTGTTFADNNITTTIEFTHGKTSATFPAGGSPYGGVIADMDGDGNNEVLFAPWDHGALFIVECDSADNYTALNYIQTDLDRNDDFAFWDFYAEDLDGDGRDEAYLSMYSAGRLYVTTCPVGTDLSAMTTADVHTIDVLGSSGGVATQMGDLDGNGKMNIYASGGGSQITVHEFNGGDPADSANWVKLDNLTSSSFAGVFGMRYAGDLDKDGYPEIYGANTGATTIAAAAIEVTQNITETFDTDANVYPWVSANSGWTSRTWVDGTLRLADAGWTIDARRPILATPNTFFRATAKIKTGSFDTNPAQYLTFGVEGIAASKMEVSCISEDNFTTFTVVGLAENAEGTLFINGQGASGADTVWVDEFTFEDDYAAGLTAIASVADARLIPDGELTATIGVVTATTEYGTAGPVYMQDATAGIAIYDYTTAQNVSNGDEILVIGEVDIYNGLVEIKNVNFMVLSTGNDVEPVEVTWADIMDAESYEGQLVVMKGCDTLATGLDWAVNAGSNKGVNLVDKNDSTFLCYIDKDTDIDGSPKPTVWPINITGIVGDYRGAQLLPRSLADFNPNSAPGPFAWINPADSTVITSLDDPMLVDVVVGMDSVKALFANWTKAVDNDPNDTVTYEMMFIGDGPEDAITTTDTAITIPLNMAAPYEMNGVYTIYLKASDLDGAESLSDTITVTFDFPAPPMVVNADVVLVDGTPMYYVEFDMPVVAEPADFTVLNLTTPGSEVATAVAAVSANAVMVTAPLAEDDVVSLIVDGVTAVGGTLTMADTTAPQVVYIPFSANHPEDAGKIIESFDENTGLFWAPTGSGSTRGILTSSTFASVDSNVYQGTGSGRLDLLDDPAVAGGWYVRLYHTLSHQVKSNSTLMFLVKGTGNVEMRISAKDTGYEQGPWKRVSLCENDWQVVSFDLANDVPEGWITGNGVIEGETMLIEAIHMRSTEDSDVVLYIDGFTERQVLSPVDVTLNVMMHEWLRRGDFALATDYVDVAGTMNGWGGTPMILDDFDGDTTYSITIPMLPYSRMEFKFRINGSWNDATAEFPYGGPARVISSVRTYNYSYTYWYNNDTLIDVPEAVDAIPVEFALHQNYPNPFNPMTTIDFDLPEIADVSLVIYDITGRKVRTLVSESNIDAGFKRIVWNGRDDMGNSVATGMYIYRLQAGDYVDVKKMSFLK